MESSNENKMELCRNCKAFYGSEDREFYCSKCFKEHKDIRQQIDEVATSLSPEKQFSESSQQQLPSLVEQAKQVQLPESSTFEPAVEEKKTEAVSAEPVKDAPAEESQQVEVDPTIQTNTNKCWNCNKKVGILKVQCKCTYVFCSKHRLAEDHNCTYDYFGEQQKKIALENPLIQNKKMEKMF